MRVAAVCECFKQSVIVCVCLLYLDLTYVRARVCVCRVCTRHIELPECAATEEAVRTGQLMSVR